jgi:hypothetical protein
VALFEDLFQAFDDAGVRYVVVGGVAVVLHGCPRLTGDLDLAVDLAPAAAARAIRVLVDAGLRPRAPVDPFDFADPDKRAVWEREKGMRVFSLADPSNPLREVDLFVQNPIDFEKLWARAEIMRLDRVAVRVASIADLIDMKRQVGRPQDLADVEALALIQERRGKHDG